MSKWISHVGTDGENSDSLHTLSRWLLLHGHKRLKYLYGRKV